MAGRMRAAALLALMAALAAGCNRNAAPMTPCEGDRPAVERTRDVAPPNCTDALPGGPGAA